ncbi:MAG: Os1348 family NHLP clan protein [Dehalococcoidia bacterium]|nr:Os1348 family NHLP clan protein [Dehalococcoidia bacterium]
MSYSSAQSVFGMAIVDAAFRNSLLDCPAKAIAGFDLTKDEFVTLAAIRASTLQQFTANFEQWRLANSVGRERLLDTYPEDTSSDVRLAG